jgi:hypothetical protein
MRERSNLPLHGLFLFSSAPLLAPRRCLPYVMVVVAVTDMPSGVFEFASFMPYPKQSSHQNEMCVVGVNTGSNHFIEYDCTFATLCWRSPL